MGGPIEWLFASIREHTPYIPILRCQADCIFHSPMSVLMVSLCAFSDELFQALLISIYKAPHTVLIWLICTQRIGTWKKQYIPPPPPQVCSVIDGGRKDEQSRQANSFLLPLWLSLSNYSVDKAPLESHLSCLYCSGSESDPLIYTVLA